MEFWTIAGAVLLLAGLVVSFIFSKAWFKSLVFILLCCIVLALADFVLVPSGYIRFILHQLNTGEDYELLVLGASHGRSAINPYKLEENLGKCSINASIPGETVEDSYYLLKETCRKKVPQIVVLDLDYQYWCNFVEREFGDTFIYSQMKWSPVKLEYVADNLLDKDFRTLFMKRWAWVSSKDEIVENLKTKLSAPYWRYDISAVKVRDAGGPYEGRGYFRRQRDLADKGEYIAFAWDEARIHKKTLKYFRKIADFCREKDIKLICVTSPLPPYAVERGPSGEAFEYFKRITGEQGVAYFDCNLLREEVLPRSNEDYVDWDGHMTGDLAETYSDVLGKVLVDYLGGKSCEKYFHTDYKSRKHSQSVPKTGSFVPNIQK